MTVVASNYARKENDLYQTEPWATMALLRHLNVKGARIWEPTAGNHLIADVLREEGATVVATDIVRYDRDHDEIYDFFSKKADPFGMMRPDMIIANPPYGKSNRDAVRFAELALKRCSGWVALLLTMKFDSGKTRTHLFRDNPRFAAKIVLLDRIQWFAGPTSGTEDHCWMVWGPIGEVSLPTIFYEAKET